MLDYLEMLKRVLQALVCHVLHCGPSAEIVSHATPPHSVKVKMNFNEAQNLTWKEIKCLYSLLTIITSNDISELLKMQLESKSRNFHT